MVKEATPIHIPRRERRLAERKAHPETRKSSDQSQRISRRTFLGLGAVGAVAAGVGVFELTHRNEGDTYQENLATISGYFREVGANPNPQEVLVLSHFYPETKNSTSITDETSTETEVQGSIKSTFEVMANSSLPLFRNASVMADKYGRLEELAILTEPTLDKFGKDTFMITTSRITKDKNDQDILQHVIGVDTQDVWRDSSGFLLGIEFVHEMTHVQRRIKYLQMYGGSHNLDEQLQMVKDYSKANRIDDEAAAYGDQCQAVLDAIGTGYNVSLPPDLIDLTAMYVRCDHNPLSAKWKDSIYKRLVKFKEI